MRRSPASTFLLLHEGGPLAQRLEADILAAGLSLRSLAEGEGLEALRAMVAAQTEPAAVLLGPDLAQPLGTARQVHRCAPLVQIVFITAEANAPQLRRSLRLAPMIGNHWTLVDDHPDQVLSAARDAARSSHQRRQLRTTLDRLNMRLAEPPPADSERYRKLVISDRYLASILASAQDAILSADAQGTILTWNQGATELFGLSEGEAARRPLTALARGPEAEALLALLGAAQAGERARRELRLSRADGSSFAAEITVAPVRSEGGQLVAFSLIARDVSERTRARLELERRAAEVSALNAELELRVAERTAQLVEANKELETFAYTVSHDLRTPLGGISGFCQALQEDYAGHLDDTARHYLERIQRNAERMGRLIDDVLALSRVSRRPLRRDRVNLCDLAGAILDELRQGAPERRVTFDCTAGWAEGDGALLQIALENLLGNAWKYSSSREETRLAFSAQQEAGETVYALRDNGVGFDMLYAAKLFEVFQRLHSDKDYQGTGVGLATVRRIVERHGGRVWADAEVDGGATFYFTLAPAAPR